MAGLYKPGGLGRVGSGQPIPSIFDKRRKQRQARRARGGFERQHSRSGSRRNCEPRRQRRASFSSCVSSPQRTRSPMVLRPGSCQASDSADVNLGGLSSAPSSPPPEMSTVSVCVGACAHATALGAALSDIAAAQSSLSGVTQCGRGMLGPQCAVGRLARRGRVSRRAERGPRRHDSAHKASNGCRQWQCGRACGDAARLRAPWSRRRVRNDRSARIRDWRALTDRNRLPPTRRASWRGPHAGRRPGGGPMTRAGMSPVLLTCAQPRAARPVTEGAAAPREAKATRTQVAR